jgi:uncharacterized membrane protein
MIVIGIVLSDPSPLVLLMSFNLGFAITDMIMVAVLVRRFGVRIRQDPELVKFALRKWELPVAGIAYAIGIWADKVIMWLGSPSGGLSVGGY